MINVGVGLRQHHDFLLPMVPIVQEVGLRGIPIDQQRRSSMIATLQERQNRLDTQLQGVGIRDANSNYKLSKDLLDLGVPLTVRTKSKKQFKVDLEQLGWINFRHNTRRTTANLEPKFPFLPALLERAKVAKSLRNLVALRACDDGLLRTRLNALGTKTLRYSSGGWGRKGVAGYCPACQRWASDGHGCNLQNIAKDNLELGVSIKDVFRAKPGWLFGELDYKALELHIQAYCIGSDLLRERIETPGSDMHSHHARLRWPDFDKNAPDGSRKRRLAKNIIYGLRGGGGDHALQADCAKGGEFLELEEFTSFRRVIFKEYPEMDAWIERSREAITEAIATGHRRICYTGFGWPRVLFGHPADVLKEALATVISGTAAGGLNYVLWKLATQHPEAFRRVALQIHDSLFVHAPEAEFRGVMATVASVMREPWWIWDSIVRFGVDPKWGERWSGMRTWEE